MAGHSKWSKVKRIEGPRGVQFGKLAKKIAVAATDNKNRASADPRLVSSRHDGCLATEDTHCATAEVHRSEGTAARVLHLHETLEDNDDTQNVYSHFDIPEALLARLPA